jgi:hypothetical protein
VGGDLRSSRACAAETVGMRSGCCCQGRGSRGWIGFLRAIGDEKLDIPGPWIDS